MRLIDADALFEAFNKAEWFDNADRDDIALEIILEAPTISPPSNDPLTTEELRKMEGEPVWLRGSGLNRWYIFDGFSLDGIAFFTPEIGYGKLWAAYRRRPEEGMTHE